MHPPRLITSISHQHHQHHQHHNHHRHRHSSSSSSSSSAPRPLESHFFSLENATPLVSRLVKSSLPPLPSFPPGRRSDRTFRVIVRSSTAAFQASGMKGDYPWLAHDATQRTSPATAKICLPHGGGKAIRHSNAGRGEIGPRLQRRERSHMGLPPSSVLALLRRTNFLSFTVVHLQ